jgi:acetyl-CoA synthetase
MAQTQFPILKGPTLCTPEQYETLYQKSLTDPEGFWGDEARKRLTWIKPFQQVKDCTFHSPVRIRWFVGGQLNACFDCIDRHLATHANQTAILWEPDEPTQPNRKITYQELHDEVAKLANALKRHHVKKGDRVIIYLPMIPEAVFAMLACARIGAVHSVVFAGFSPDSIADRVLDCGAEFIITADEGRRGGKRIPLKANVDQALQRCPDVKNVLVVQHTKAAVHFQHGRDLWYHEEIVKEQPQCAPEPMDSEAPLFILYTSGSTNKPKGVLHGTGGYLVYTSMTHEYVFDYRAGAVYWCTADVGWVTGHSYSVYGPLANRATVLLFEGVPHFPDVSRFWQIIDKYNVEIFYTAPTAIRALMKDGEAPVRSTSRKSLRILGTVGEPINPEAWLWYYHVVGNSQCPIVDTWWQTETGGILISPLPGAIAQKPGSVTRPFFGIQPVLVDERGQPQSGPATGNLCLKDSWPGQMLTLYKDHSRFEQTYFSTYKGFYFSGDGARVDEDGDWWVTGRVDDVLNVSGHRLGTAEIESALVGHTDVAEAAVVGYPHDIKGTGIYVFVTLKAGVEPTENLRKALVNQVRHEIGAIATPDKIQWAPQLPKTRSGKIMRRILRKIAENQIDTFGDTSTLAEPQVVEALIKNRIA